MPGLYFWAVVLRPALGGQFTNKDNGPPDNMLQCEAILGTGPKQAPGSIVTRLIRLLACLRRGTATKQIGIAYYPLVSFILLCPAILASVITTGCAGFSIGTASAGTPLSITTSSLPSGTQNVAYSTTLAATGSKTSYTWSITSGSLPTGVTLTASSGLISGTPTQSGTFPITVQVKDSSAPAQTASQGFSIVIAAAGTPLSITTSSLPSGTQNVAYSTTLAATGGKTSYTWSITSGSLPTGVTLTASSGLISGTPTQSGTFPITVQVKDSSAPAQTASQGFSIVIAAAGTPLSITTSSLPSGTQNVAYSTTLAATGGKTSYTWSITSGSLPTGVTLTASPGLISGTPTQSGTFPITVQVKDSSAPAQTASQGFSIVIAAAGAPVSITTSSLPSGTQNSAYSATLAAAGGTKPYRWSITSGALPAGLTLTSSPGLISGTPTQAGTFPITVQVQDSSSPAQIASRGFSIVTSPSQQAPPQISASQTSVNVLTGGAASVMLRVTGTPTPGVSCAVNGAGTVQLSGSLVTYTAPNTAPADGQAMIVCTASNVAGSATVSITAKILAVIPGYSGPVPSSFFGMTIMESNDWPSIPFGALGKGPGMAWPYVEETKGTFNWTQLDAYVAQANAHGVSFVYTSVFVPSWAAADKSSCKPNYAYGATVCTSTVANIEDWTDFMTALVTRYKGRIQVYELWNEASCSCYYTGTVAQLVALTKTEHDVIRSIDPEALIVGPTMQGYASAYLDSYFAAGGTTDIDAVGMHSSPNPANDVAEFIMGSVTTGIQSVMKKYGLSSKPLWNTENDWGNDASLTDPDDRAAFVARDLLLNWNVGVTRDYWYTWDNPNVGTLWSPTGGVSEAATAYEQVKSWMQGATMAPCSLNGSTNFYHALYTCNLTLSNGSQAQAVWYTDGDKTYTVPSQFTQYRDLAGNTNSVPSNHQVTIGVKPILLENF